MFTWKTHDGLCFATKSEKIWNKMEFEDLKVEVPLDEEIASDLLDVPVSLLIVHEKIY